MNMHGISNGKILFLKKGENGKKRSTDHLNIDFIAPHLCEMPFKM